MKKILTFIAALMMMLACMAVPAAAADGDLVADNADLLTPSEESALTERLESIRTGYGLDIVVLTVDSTDGLSAMTYADNYYDENGYGGDGALLLLNMDTENDGENREWWISTTGTGIDIFTDYGIEYIGSKVAVYLSAGEYAQAFDLYADLAVDFINEYNESHQAFDTNNEYYDPEAEIRKGKDINWIIPAIVGVAAGLIAGFVSRSRGRAKHKSVRYRPDAGDYVVQGSLRVTGASDSFLYKNLAVVPIPRQDGGGHGGGHGGGPGGHGGGSGVHMGGGGVHHGGGGGRF